MEDIRDLLPVGKRVALQLGNGEELTGIVLSVGDDEVKIAVKRPGLSEFGEVYARSEIESVAPPSEQPNGPPPPTSRRRTTSVYYPRFNSGFRR